MRPTPSTRFPARLWLVRHGESAGNVANAAALASQSQRIDLLGRDMDIPLSPLGEQQAHALGDWFAAMAPAEGPQHILASPYARARATAKAIATQAGLWEELIVDERLREKELGTLDGLTRYGIEALYPGELKLRATLGKFYYRPPNGESWCDVILRLRSVWESICLHHAQQRLVVVGHQVVVLCFRYILEALNEEDVLRIDGEGDVKNCSVTEYVPDEGARGGMALVRYNFTAPLEEAGAPVTAEKSAQKV